MKERLSDVEVKILKKYAEALLSKFDILKDEVGYYIEVLNYDDFSSLLTDDIIYEGMDNQDTVNDIGRELYAIHDRIMYS